AAHMRDVFNLFRRRTELMLAETDPRLDNFDGDAVAIASDYEHQNPAEVALALRAAAESYADRLSQLPGDEWHRRGYRPDRRGLIHVTRVGADRHRFARAAHARPLVGAGAGPGGCR